MVEIYYSALIIIIIIIIILTFVRRTLSASELNLRRLILLMPNIDY